MGEKKTEEDSKKKKTCWPSKKKGLSADPMEHGHYFIVRGVCTLKKGGKNCSRGMYNEVLGKSKGGLCLNPMIYGTQKRNGSPVRIVKEGPDREKLSAAGVRVWGRAKLVHGGWTGKPWDA